MSPRKVCFFSCCAFLCGCVARAFVYDGVEPFFLFLGLMSVSSAALFFRKNISVCIPMVFCAVFLLGMMRMAMGEGVHTQSDRNISQKTKQVSMSGTVSAEPIITESRQILPIHNGRVSDGEDTNMIQKVRVFAPFIPSYQYGDELVIRCSLLPSREWQSPICVQAEIKRVSRGKGNVLIAALLRGKDFFLQGIRTHLSEPHASLLGALLVGERSGFPPWLTEAFIRSGIFHIVAISGYNITIIIVSMYAVLRACFFGRKQSFWCIVIGIFFFVLITGSSASVVRAAIMGIIVLFAQYIGRKNDITNALLLAASAMIFWQPEVLFTIGFQLSFAATCGLVYVSPIFERMVEKISDLYGIKTLVLQTISAILATAPLVIFLFQRFSVIALIANMLILPIIPLVMALGFFWTGLTFIGGILYLILPVSFDLFIQAASWPVWFLLSYIMIVARWFSNISWASLDVRLGEWSWVFGIVSYACIVWLVWFHEAILKKKQYMIQCDHVKKNKEI